MSSTIGKVRISPAVPDDDPMKDEKLFLCKAHHLPSTFDLSLNPSTGSTIGLSILLDALRIGALVSQDAYFYEEPIASSSYHPIQSPISPRNERKALADARILLQAALSACTTEEQKTIVQSALNEIRLLSSSFCEPANSSKSTQQIQNSESEELIAFMKEEGINSDNFILSEFNDNSGRGIAANRDFAQGATVFEIPSSLVLNLNSALASPDFGPLLRQLQTERPDFHIDSLTIIFAMMERSKGRASRWHHYFSLVPKEYSTLLTYSPEDLIFLQGTSLFDETLASVGNLHRIYNDMIPYLLEKHSADYFNTPEKRDALSWDSFLYMQCLFSSRAFEPEINGKKVLSLFPIADMLNHSPYAQVTTLKYDSEADVMRFSCFSDIPRGSQLFLNYGALQNHQLLTHYGYVDPAGTPYDTYDFAFQPDEEDPFYQAKVAILSGLGFTGHGIRRSMKTSSVAASSSSSSSSQTLTIPSKLMYALRICMMDDDDFGLLMADSSAYQKPLSERNEMDCLSVLERTIQSLLDNFPSTIAEDKRCVKDNKDYTSPPENPLLTDKQRNAVVFRVTVKELLIQAMSATKKLKTQRTAEFASKPKLAKAGAAAAKGKMPEAAAPLKNKKGKRR